MNVNFPGFEAALTNRFAFPGGGDLRSFPPTYLLDADRDSLRASGAAFAQELQAAGVRTRYEVVAESKHGFLDRLRSSHFMSGVHSSSAWLFDCA